MGSISKEATVLSVYDVLKGRYGIESPVLIAEIGNNHFGSIKLAKTLIKLAHKAGADLVKFQAGVKSGSMQPEFYKRCQFTVSEYLDLIEFGKVVGTTVFFSIFDKAYSEIDNHQQFRKIAAIQSRDITDTSYDDSRTFVSYKEIHPRHLASCAPMIASDYNGRQMPFLPVGYGYSCHIDGIHSCVTAVQEFDAPVIEKHFTLEKGMAFKGNVFRDTIHGVTPEEFGKLASIVKGRL